MFHEDKKKRDFCSLSRHGFYLILPNPRVKASWCWWTDDGKFTLLKYRSDGDRIYVNLTDGS